jgi:hypothetical protein
MKEVEGVDGLTAGEGSDSLAIFATNSFPQINK